LSEEKISDKVEFGDLLKETGDEKWNPHVK
jgi:hypothetical protein